MSALGQKRTGVLSLASQERLVKRLLDRVEHPSSRLRQIAGKVAQECSLGKSCFVAVEDNARRRGRRRKLATLCSRSRSHGALPARSGRLAPWYSWAAPAHVALALASQSRRLLPWRSRHSSPVWRSSLHRSAST